MLKKSCQASCQHKGWFCHLLGNKLKKCCNPVSDFIRYFPIGLIYIALFKSILIRISMSKSRISLCLTFLCVSLICLTSTEAQAFSVKSKGYAKEITSCDAALESIPKRISADNRRISVSIDSQEIRESLPEMISDRPYRLIVSMRGNVSDMGNVMYSEQLLTSITKAVIGNCNRVSVVSYAVSNSDYIRDYGITLNGKVQKFQCIDPRTLRLGLQTLSWGQYPCL